MKCSVMAVGCALVLALRSLSLSAQAHPGEHVPDPAPEAAASSGNVLRSISTRSPWPSPVLDDETYSLWLFELLEYAHLRDVGALRWDFVGWHGTDKRRLWFKSEGELYEGGGGEFDVQALFGRAISPFFDLQAGLRFEQHQEGDETPRRGFVAVGVQGLAPYRIEIDPVLLLSDRGKLSLRVTASHDTRFTQRWILQPRLETEVSAQGDDEFGVEAGINDVEAGLRLRYEVRREVAPYMGLSYRTSLGATRARVRREGGDTEELQAVLGVRAWF